MIVRLALAVGLLGLACAKPAPQPVPVPMPVTPEEAKRAQAEANAPVEKFYKRKVAVGRFSNETNYGRGLLVDSDLDPLGKQASDVLATQLQRSGRFMIFERPDLSKIQREQALAGVGGIVGVDALIVGSVTEFGRSTAGQKGFLSSTKRQLAHAKVNLRLIDVTTGRVFLAADGTGESTHESGEIAGYGSAAAYDSTLNEKAISAAISDVMTEIINELEARPWRTYVLAYEGGMVYLAGGSRQGLAAGDELAIIRKGASIKSLQTGLPIELPGVEVARVRVESHFGDDEASEGSVCSVVDGAIDVAELESLYVIEPKE
ncbi:MAG: curli production assembly protein CsgG [Deltaproteobacteria bacterium]|nr:curli production assembly protein CsgG [Deltaproteobacteria bacterium]MBW2418901.1 curli production assembly protein CsgG [Deltaproteobacteria bacterium]